MLSVVIIAKNAEEQIVDAIASAKFADEVLVIDNGSTDKTITLSKKHKARIISLKQADFASLRNIGLKEAKGEWIYYLDTDEQFTPQLQEEISNIAKNGSREFVAYKIRRKNYYLGNHEWPTTEMLERFFSKDKLRGWHGELHESPIVDGKIGQLNGFLLHYTHQNLSAMLAKTIEWSRIEAKLRLAAGHPKMIWWRFFRVMITAFFDSYIKQRGWKLGIVGLIESMYQSFSIFITYARLWEMQNKVKS